MLRRKQATFVVLVSLAALSVTAATLSLPRGGEAPAAQPVAVQQLKAATAGPEPPADKPEPLAPAATPALATTAVSETDIAVAPNAVRQNEELRGRLDWFFGGKQQRGWSIYEPLIARTLGVETEAAPDEFARAVARWQKTAGHQPTGVLDRATWMLMVQTWQSRRLGSSAYPRPDELVTVSASEFWDPGRAAEMRQVERTTYAAYRRMLAAAAADPSLGLRTRPDGELDESEKFFKIVSAYRSREYQERLRRADPSSGRAGLARNSPHFTGRALDLYVGGYDPVSTKDDNRLLQTQTKAYRWLVRHAESFGFRPYYYEPWHWEYVGR
jgi:D-alanyl-D-alanine carboxypeptidase